MGASRARPRRERVDTRQRLKVDGAKGKSTCVRIEKILCNVQSDTADDADQLIEGGIY